MLTGWSMSRRSKERFFGAIRSLLPTGRAWDITQKTNLRRVFESLVPLPDDIRRELEAVYMDNFPDTTRALEKWEEIFHVRFSASLFTYGERRIILKALWLMRYGNTTAQFMQSVLRMFFPGVRVTENVPVVNAPGVVFEYKSLNGMPYMCCGNRRAVCDYHIGNHDWVPTVLRNNTQAPWDMFGGDAYSSMCFFISRDVWRDVDGKIQVLQRLKIHEKWQAFFEYMVLALKPVHTTAILFVLYVPNDDEIVYT